MPITKHTTCSVYVLKWDQTVGEASSGWSLGVGGALEWVELWSGWSLRVVVNLHFSKSRTSNLSWHYQADGTALAQTLDENVTDLVLPI